MKKIKHIKVRVYPDQTEEKVVVSGEDSYEIFLREPAKQGMANKRLLEILLEKISPRPLRLKIQSGHTSPSKIIAVEW